MNSWQCILLFSLNLNSKQYIQYPISDQTDWRWSLRVKNTFKTNNNCKYIFTFYAWLAVNAIENVIWKCNRWSYSIWLYRRIQINSLLSKRPIHYSLYEISLFFNKFDKSIINTPSVFIHLGIIFFRRENQDESDSSGEK